MVGSFFRSVPKNLPYFDCFHLLSYIMVSMVMEGTHDGFRARSGKLLSDLKMSDMLFAEHVFLQVQLFFFFLAIDMTQSTKTTIIFNKK